MLHAPWAGWDLADEERVPNYLAAHYAPLRASLEESVRRLRARWPDEELGALATAMYFDPAGWQHRYDFRDNRHQARRVVILRILSLCAARFPPPGILRYIERRLRMPDRDDLPPDGDTCLQLLQALPPSAETLDLLERGLWGDLACRSIPKPSLLRHLYEHGRFGYAAFRRVARARPGLLRMVGGRYGGPPYHTGSAEFDRVLRDYCSRLARDLARDPGEGGIVLLAELEGLRGGPDLLLGAARLHRECHGRLLEFARQGRSSELDATIVNLAGAAEADALPDAERRALGEELRASPPETLRALLPVAFGSPGVIAGALDWERATPLIELLVRTARLRDLERWHSDALVNSSDPSLGVLDVADARAALEGAGADLARAVFKLYCAAVPQSRRTIKLFEALAGWKEAASWVEERLAKGDQFALKAYGLLPLERGEEEVLERYLFLKDREGRSRYATPHRAAHERAAAQAGLANLAGVAGYADATRLAWAMEARLGGGAAPGRSWTVDDYRVDLELEGGEPRLTFRRGERALKTAPAAVRQSAVHAEMKEAVTLLRGQAARFRASLEGLLAGGEPLGRDDLAALARLPVTAALLERLILRTDEGATGLFEPATLTLRGLDGAAVPVGDRARIAHPYHLFEAGELAAWQREIVRRRVVQPFKQAFRELYLLTPAEEATATYSGRFAGHLLDARVASRLFPARGWQIEASEVATPSRPFPRAGLEATFHFADAGHFLAENDTITSDRIAFAHHPPRPDAWRPGEDSSVSLRDVPPVVFSEVMRDADLVVSVAQREGEGRLSAEAYQRRGELVATLLAELGLPGVTVDGHFARVRGKLADYRVHLGSAAIHIEPGNYLCVVPARWGRRHERLFLPFADEGDAKVGEVVSKVLLLANDDRIEDETILRQIRARRGA